MAAPALDKDAITKTIFQNYNDLKISYAAIRGSWIYGTQDELSDIDLLVIVEKEVVPEIPEVKEGELVNEQDAGKKYEIDFSDTTLDITVISMARYRDNVEHHCVRAVEALFIPKDLILYGDLEEVKKSFLKKLYLPVLRKYFSQVSDRAWNRGCKKLIYEKDNAKEHRVGKKSLYHSLRYFVCAIQIATHREIIWDDKMMLDVKNFYLSIKDVPAADMISDEVKTNGRPKIKKVYTDRYKALLKIFKSCVFNEEQLSQFLKKQRKTKTKIK